MSMTTNTAKWTRAKAPRVRTGCVTCKKRRLKCDERKPTCQRCAAANKVCGGYEIALTRKPRMLGTRFRIIATNAEATCNENHEDLSLRLHRSLELIPTVSIDASDLYFDMDLFHHAMTVTVEDLETALSPTDFWHSYILPLGYTTQAVKSAICALGGAHRVFKNQQYKLHQSSIDLQRISVQKYNQAIHCVQSVMQSGTDRDMQIILTCCLIFISIENLHGRYAEAVRHLSAGTSLLTSLLGRSREDPAVTQRETQDVIMIKFVDDISHAFCRLGNDVWTYMRERIAPDLNLVISTNTELVGQDTEFTCIGQAEESFYHVTLLFEADRTFIVREIMDRIRDPHNKISQLITHVPSQVPADQHLIPPAELGAIFNNWSERFDRFQTRFSDCRNTSQEVLRTKSLAVEQALWSGWLKCRFWSDYQQQDYEEILRRAELLVQLDTFQSGPVFTFDGGLILSLALPCVLSMDSNIQWRAIRLLRSFWRREGIWDSQELADILEAMMIATSTGMVTKEMLPWDVPHLAWLMDSLKLQDISIPEGPLSLT